MQNNTAVPCTAPIPQRKLEPGESLHSRNELLVIEDALAKLDYEPGLTTSDGKELRKGFPFTGQVRLKLITNRNICRRLHQEMEDIRDALVAKISGGHDLLADEEQNKTFQRDMRIVMNTKVPVKWVKIPVYDEYTGTDNNVVCLTKCKLPMDPMHILIGVIFDTPENLAPKP